MAALTVEERLTELEKKVALLSGEETTTTTKKPAHWIEMHFGAFKDNPHYDAAMERGAEYRRSQPTAADESENDANDLSAGH